MTTFASAGEIATLKGRREAWEARILRFGRCKNGYHWSARIGAELVAVLPLTPVRFYFKDGLLRHPPDDLSVSPVGIVERAWADTHGVYVLFVFFDDASAVRRALVALERDHLLARTVGVSIVAKIRYAPQGDGGCVTTVHEVCAVDLVSSAAAEGCVLRSRERSEE